MVANGTEPFGTASLTTRKIPLDHVNRNPSAMDGVSHNYLSLILQGSPQEELIGIMEMTLDNLTV